MATKEVMDYMAVRGEQLDRIRREQGEDAYRRAKREDNFKHGGMFAGMAAGTAICPGVGSLAGALIGYFAGKKVSE